MIKIVALNDEDNDEINEEEVGTTQEAQEAIAESEYLRAIRLKSNGETDLCLQLLKELLQTQVINENIKNNRHDKLWVIRYNCHKNIAVISEKRSEYMTALQHYISAILIDNTDVFTLHKFGQLALKLNATDLAEYAFQNCLDRNLAHWCAAEGLLQVMNSNHNIIGAYSWATKMYLQKAESDKVTQTLNEIITLFRKHLMFFEKCVGVNIVNTCKEQSQDQHCVKILFNEAQTFSKTEANSVSQLPNLKNFQIKQLKWHSVGNFIVKVYKYLNEIKHDIIFTFDFDDMVEMSNEFDYIANETSYVATRLVKMDFADTTKFHEVVTEQPKNYLAEKCDVQSTDCNNYDSDSNVKSNSYEMNKTKHRRRCSDLHFLEQWGWHKNRRYSSRKKLERNEVDTSLNGYLRKILLKYTEKIVDDNWPFGEQIKNGNNIKTQFQCDDCKFLLTEDSFQMATKKEFYKFIQKLKDRHIDLMVLVYKWLKYISYFWMLPVPDNLKTLYNDIFKIYISHFGLSTWNQLTPKNFEASYRICILYLEINQRNKIKDNSDLWLKVFYHLLFNIGNCYIIAEKNFAKYCLRLMYIEHLLFNDRNQFKECFSCLQLMLEIFQQQEPSFVLHLPNLNGVCMNTMYIENLQLQYKRQIDVNNIPNLYEKKLWSQLVNIIIGNIESSHNNYDNEDWLRDVCVQMEVLLQSFWIMESYENCLIWSEKCLHFSVSHYLEESKSTFRCKILAELINIITSYIEAIILNEGFHIVAALSEKSLSRIIQNIIRILVYLFEGTFEKNSTHGQEINFKRPWVILHQIVLREENDSPNTLNTKVDEHEDEFIPNSFSILFTAHEYLGKRQWCTNDNGEFLQYILDVVVLNLKAPIYDVCRDIIYEYLEQVTYCLYKYPPKKARSRHLEDHEASQVKLCWPKAVQIFNLYRPNILPEFNSYKVESITSDMEQLLLKVISLMPKEFDPSKSIHHVTMFVDGQIDLPPTEANAFKMPYKLLCLFYLLADFYFKNRDFVKAIRFYSLDLAVNPTRFDSWAGMALSKASKIETKLNGLDPISLDNLWKDCEEVLRCFECCINLNRFQTLLWIEYGSFTYTIHSCFSRFLKYDSKKLSKESFANINERKNKMLTIAFNCFSLANSLQHSTSGSIADESDEGYDEKWLCQYMLGKISEKRKEEPKIYLNHYLMAANYLYENNATYPIKINHSNPTTLSVEALEVFYRINAAIIKYLESEKKISQSTGDLFNKILKDLSTSPFAYNKAKIDGNSLNILKGKVVNKSGLPSNHNTKHGNHSENIEYKISVAKSPRYVHQVKENTRNSQESSIVISSNAKYSTVSSESSTVESDYDTEDSLNENDINKPKNDATFTAEDLKIIYKMVVRNIEECATRFPEHYKSIYRLIYHYMNSPIEICDLAQSEQLLLGQYKTSLGNIVNGLFYDRKNNNLFNGIWRIPSSEIDRPGSFSAHLVKCVQIFIQLLFKTNNHNILVDLAINLYKTPDLDKRYVTDAKRKELCQQSIDYCVKILQSILQKNINKPADAEVLSLLIDIYKIHKKCVKYMNQKETVFAELLIDVYKLFINDKVDNVPDNSNFLDLAIKFCVQEVAAQKNMEKAIDSIASSSAHILMQSSNVISASTLRNFYIPGLNTRPKFRGNISKSSATAVSNSHITSVGQNVSNDLIKTPQPMSMCSLFRNRSQMARSETPEFRHLSEEYNTKIVKNEQKNVSTTPFVTSKPTIEITLQDNEFLALPQTIVINATEAVTSTLESSKKARSANVEQNVSSAEADIISSKLLGSSNYKQQNSRAKSLNKNKTTYKPYNRHHDFESSIKNSNDVINNSKIDLVSSQANIFAAYSNLLQTTTTKLSQIDYSNKCLENIEKKSKNQRAEAVKCSLLNISKNMTTFHNTIPINKISQSHQNEMTFNSQTSYASSLNPVLSTKLQNFSQQGSSIVNIISPTKTLQEKLAERQKAYQLNTAATITIDNKSNDDVIILD